MDHPKCAPSTHDPFVSWLKRNIDAVQNGVGCYEGTNITLETEAVRFQCVHSLFIVSEHWSTRFYVPGHESVLVPAVRYSLQSLLLGIWGFPWGISWTLIAVFVNLRGGNRRTVGSLINELTGHFKNVVCLTASAANLARREIDSKGFPRGTAVFVHSISTYAMEFEIQYDLPEADDRYWRGVSEGVTVLIYKDDIERIGGRVVVDATKDDCFVFSVESQN